MLSIGGELLTFINEIEFTSKQDLMTKLRAMRTKVESYEPRRRYVLKQLVGIAIQQVYRCSDTEIMRYSKFKKITKR